MDIEFIEQKYRDDIFKLMELCGIEMAEAYELYTNAGNSLERAMQMHFNETQPTGGPGFGHDYGNQKMEKYESYGNENEGDDFDSLYEKYKVYKNSGATFANRYEVRKNSSFLGSLVPKFLKGGSQSNFKKLLQTYFGRPCAIQFSSQSLSCTLAQSDKFPVVAYILDFQPAAKTKVEEILRNGQFIEIVNVQYKNVGIDPSYEIQKSLNKFVDRKKYNNCLIILRVNAIEQVQIINQISLANSTVKEALQKLKLAKNACISKDLDEAHLQRRLYQELMGNFDYEKPMSIAEKRKVAQDRQIRKKQEEQFFAAMKAESNKQRKKSQQVQNYPQPQIQAHSQSRPSPNVQKPIPQPKKQVPKRNIQQQRRKQRQKLRTYTQGMNIRLRLPNGEAIVVTVDSNERPDYLYSYVESIEKEIGFEKDDNRKFHIIRPYDKLDLSDHMGKTLKQIFEGSDSQNLAVSERD